MKFNYNSLIMGGKKFALLQTVLVPVLMAFGASHAAAQTVRTPTRATNFASNLGVGVHLSAYGGPYGSLASIETALHAIGITHLRDGMKTTSWDTARLIDLGDLGYKFDLTLEQPPAAYAPYLDQIGHFLDSVEGPNEVDEFDFQYGGLSQIPAGVALQQVIYPQIKNDSILKNIPVLNFTIGNWAATAQAGNMSAYADFANFHSYAPYGKPPGPVLVTGIQETTDVPKKPRMTTETGYSTVTWNPQSATAGGACGVSEDVQAKYILDDLFDNIHAGEARTYIYELVDEAYDPYETARAYHFGLFRSDWSAKPVATAIEALQSILSDTSPTGRTFVPTQLTYQLTDPSVTPINFSQDSYLFQKSSGAYFLVVWAEPQIWNLAGHVEYPAQPAHILTLALTKTATSIKVMDPMKGNSAARAVVTSVSNVSELKFSVVDHPIVVEIVP